MENPCLTKFKIGREKISSQVNIIKSIQYLLAGSLVTLDLFSNVDALLLVEPDFISFKALTLSVAVTLESEN